MTKRSIPNIAVRIAVAVTLQIFLLGPRCLEAQALPTATAPGTYVSVGGSVSRVESDYGHQEITGWSIYADSNLVWRYGIETKVSRITYPQFGESQTTVLAGPRWALRTHGLVPYARVLAGGGRFQFPYHYGYGDYLVIAPAAGVDYRVNQVVRVRLADFEYQEWPAFSFGSLHPYGLSAGVSIQVFSGLGGISKRLKK